MLFQLVQAVEMVAGLPAPPEGQEESLAAVLAGVRMEAMAMVGVVAAIQRSARIANS